MDICAQILYKYCTHQEKRFSIGMLVFMGITVTVPKLKRGQGLWQNSIVALL